MIISLKSVKKLGFLSVTLIAWQGCTTPQGAELSAGDGVKITETLSPSTVTVVQAKPTSGAADYSHAGRSAKAVWMTCEAPKSKGLVLVNHSDTAGFAPDKFCTGWLAQTLLQAGWDVVAVNRPGFGGSTGKNDVAGPASIAAIEAGVKAATKGRPVTGVMGYSSGVIAASFWAKKNPGPAWMILGGGIYDSELLAKSPAESELKKSLLAQAKLEGDVAWEARSIAWDLSGLPKRILIYHGKSNTVVPPSQAQSFRDSLASSEYLVTINIVDGVEHVIPWVNHQQILQVLLKSLDATPPSRS